MTNVVIGEQHNLFNANRIGAFVVVVGAAVVVVMV